MRGMSDMPKDLPPPPAAKPKLPAEEVSAGRRLRDDNPRRTP